MSISDVWHTSCQSAFCAELIHSIKSLPARQVLEVGAGRQPLLSSQEIPKSVDRYTVSDLDAEELALLPPELDSIILDVTGDISSFHCKFDVIFSKYCAEHIRDGYLFHKNIHQMLSPGGVALHLFPTLWASPFFINYILPDFIASKIVKTFQKERFEVGYGKFPAYYSLCRGSNAFFQRKLQNIGYADISVRSFFGHSYYRSIPILSEVDDALSRFCAQRNWNFYSSFAILRLQKRID